MSLKFNISFAPTSQCFVALTVQFLATSAQPHSVGKNQTKSLILQRCERSELPCQKNWIFAPKINQLESFFDNIFLSINASFHNWSSSMNIFSIKIFLKKIFSIQKKFFFFEWDFFGGYLPSLVFRPSWIYRVSNLIRKCRMYLWGSKKTLYVVLGLGKKILHFIHEANFKS